MRSRFASSLPSTSICSRSQRVLARTLVVLLGLFAVAGGPSLAQDPPSVNRTYPAAGRIQDAAEAARAVEAARVQAFLDARYKPSEVQHSFQTKLGDTIDCIDFFAQAGVKALAARGTPITKVPPSVARPQRPNALFDGEPDENKNRRLCPAGTVAHVRITPEQIQRAGGLDAWLAGLRKGALPPAGSERHGLNNSAPPESGLPGYAHTLRNSTGNNITSGEAWLSIYTPRVPNAGDHSLMQTWTVTGSNSSKAATPPSTPAVPCPANCRQTVEAGWNVDPKIYLDNNPHFFIYATPDGYWSGCYNGSIPANNGSVSTCPIWVGLSSSFPPGLKLPSSVPGSTQEFQAQELHVAVTRCSITSDCENGWEVSASVSTDSSSSYSPVGYYPDADFGTTFGTAARFSVGGEVYEQAARPSDTLFTLPMGSGSVATAGYGQAAFVAAPHWTSASGSGNSFNGGFDNPSSTVPKYAVWRNPNVGQIDLDLDIDFYLGAPPPPPAPAPAPPPCPPFNPSSEDRFYPEPSNSPVVVEQASTAVISLVLDGPWIGPDHGNHAAGRIAYDNLPTGRTLSVQPASPDNLGHSYALMEFFVTIPPFARSGSYIVKVEATDLGSCRVMETDVPIQVLDCTPHISCGTPGIQTCGAISNGCGQTVNCGACPSGQSCTNHACCPVGRYYNTALGVCQPLSCPVGTSFCIYTGDCATNKACKDKPICHRVGKVNECE